MATKIEDDFTPKFRAWNKDVILTLKKVMRVANEETVAEVRQLQLNGQGFFWTNRTRKAGKNISGRVRYRNKEIVSEIGHGKEVPYGFFLEVDNQGRYGFLPKGLKMLKYKTLLYLKKLGFEFDFSTKPYRPTPNDRLAAQRKNNR